MRFVVEWAKSGRLRIAYSLGGEPNAPPLLMLRGLARTSRHWGPVLDELARSFRVVVMDNRGIGRSDVPLLPFTTADMADDAARVLDRAGVESAHVFGISLGGMIAQELALRHPARLMRLALGCTRAGGASSQSLPVSTALELLRPMRLPPERAIRESAKLILSPEFLAAHPEVLDEWVELAHLLPPSRRGVVFQLIAAARHDTSRRISTLAVPTLVVTGDADRLIAAENSRWLAEAIPGARLRYLRGAGHDFATEQPRETAALAREFFL